MSKKRASDISLGKAIIYQQGVAEAINHIAYNYAEDEDLDKAMFQFRSVIDAYDEWKIPKKKAKEEKDLKLTKVQAQWINALEAFNDLFEWDDDKNEVIRMKRNVKKDDLMAAILLAIKALIELKPDMKNGESDE